MRLTIASIERFRVHVPFTPRTRKWNEILVGGWGLIELCKVTTDSGVVGWGETLLNYTWKKVDDAAAARVVGQPLFDHLWDDSLGAGLQMALFDAAGHALEMPINRLFGLPTVREQVPVAWWSTKMSPEDLAAEAAEAASRGYRAHKFKARPWFDVYEQVEMVTAATPDDYGLGIDWNSLLLTAAGARDVLERLDEHPRVHFMEGPVGRAQVADQRAIRARLRTPLVEHFDPALFPTWIQNEALDGFVVDIGGVSRFLQTGATCAAFNKEFWLQLCGTGLTTALALHLGSVLSHARWPSVTAMNVFESTLVNESLEPTLGFVPVPDGPGLGVTVDEDALDRYRVADDFEVVLPRTILVFSTPSGITREYASVNHLWKDCLDDATIGVQVRGTRLDVVPDDGSDEFSRRHAAAGKRFGATGVAWPGLTFYPGLDT
ncbi:hypothetical protein BH10ACT7_BH10ACT7_10140 [soil metagenome]